MNREEEQKLTEEASRGARANALLQSDVYRDAMAKVEAGIIERWKASPVRDLDGQHELRLMYKLLADLQGYINEVATTGKMAMQTLEQERSLAQRARAAVREFRR